MKYIITERQLKLIKESEEKVLYIPTLSLFNNDWESLQKYLNKKGNPSYSIGGDLDLRNTNIKSLGNLISVDGNLDLYNSNIKSLGNLTSVGGDLNLRASRIMSLGNLTSVGGELQLGATDIKSLGNLTYVGGDLNIEWSDIESFGKLKLVGKSLFIWNTQIYQKYSNEEIHDMIDIGGMIIS